MTFHIMTVLILSSHKMQNNIPILRFVPDLGCEVNKHHAWRQMKLTCSPLVGKKWNYVMTKYMFWEDTTTLDHQNLISLFLSR